MSNVLFLVLSVVLSVISSISFIHIFQLNSYRHKRYLKWAKEHKTRFLPYLLVLVLGVLLGALAENLVSMIILSAVFLIISLSSVLKKAKKPLVYTKRVQRLLCAVSFVYALIAVLSSFTDSEALVMAIGFSFSGCLILVSDILVMPIEKSINRYYINDAKKMLESAKNKLRVIGITGSYGKTSVKFYLTSLLSAKYNVLCTPESFNTPLGVVKTIRTSLSAMHDIFICEMGAKNVGDIKEICDIVNPDHGVITSVGPQHLETFKTLDNVKKTKFELSCAIDCGMLFLNGDDENIVSYNDNKTAVFYGFGENNDYRATILKVTVDGTEFKVTKKDGAVCIYETKLIGAHNVLNITGAIACANMLGISLNELKPQVRKLSCVPHRLELINRGSITIIDDAYNSNPKGAKAALDTLSMFDGMKILVTPGMVELGDAQNQCNYEFGKQAASVCDYIALVGKKQTESIAKGIVDSGFDEDKLYIADNLSDAINNVYSLGSAKEKIVLLENDLPDNFL